MTATTVEPLANGELGFLLHAAKRAGERSTVGSPDRLLQVSLSVTLALVLAWDAVSVVTSLHGSTLI